MVPLSSLAAWSVQHIRNVFEAPSDELSRRAVAATFSPALAASLNGKALDFDGLCWLVSSMRASAPGGLKVEWKHPNEAPDDVLNRNGSLVGEYIIRGIWKNVPDSDSDDLRLCEFERHKKVDVRIESQSSEPGLDSRLIVRLGIVASDILVVDRSKSW
ncbi:hypothetical protein B0H17DRAFT_972131 [Mycena rosella]|uniref:Uncharacterized protein n=1 Tax=Mycena rosella TaxID=1033263 RepID=A0AAD7GXP8_MYCRO|nr:hypothetical protein B0H17DRAFT_972131 [Mycena rosella]